MHFFLDLDGPILDVSRRHWRTYADLLGAHGDCALSLERYWAMKRSKTVTAEILAASGCSYPSDDFVADWVALVETRRYLLYDEPWSHTAELLRGLQKEGNTVLVTLRRSRKELEWELELYGLREYFDDILSSGEQTLPRWQVKIDLILKAGYKPTPDDFMIGDTETDILAGQALGVWTIGITCGIRNAELLAQCRPDFLFDSLADFSNRTLWDQLLRQTQGAGPPTKSER